MPQAKRMADFMAESLELFLRCLAEEDRINVQLVPACVREEGAREHASVRITVVRGSHHDFEVIRIRALPELHGGGIPPSQQCLAKDTLDRRTRCGRIPERLQRSIRELPPQDHTWCPQRDK